MKKFFIILPCLFVAFPGAFSRQLASEWPLKEPLVFKAKTQIFYNPFALSPLGQLALRLENFSMSPMLGQGVVSEFSFINTAWPYTDHITQFFALTCDPGGMIFWRHQKVPP